MTKDGSVQEKMQAVSIWAPPRTYSKDICSKNEILVHTYENTYIKVEKKNVHFSKIIAMQIKTTIAYQILK